MDYLFFFLCENKKCLKMLRDASEQKLRAMTPLLPQIQILERSWLNHSHYSTKGMVCFTLPDEMASPICILILLYSFSAP